MRTPEFSHGVHSLFPNVFTSASFTSSTLSFFLWNVLGRGASDVVFFSFGLS